MGKIFDSDGEKKDLLNRDNSLNLKLFYNNKLMV